MRVVAALFLCCAACGGTDDTPAATGPTLTAPTTPAPATAAQPGATTPTTTAIPAAATYTVEAGDSLFAIADRLCVDLDALVAANAWTDGIEHPIFPGDQIAVPDGACTSAATAAPNTADVSAGPSVDTTRFEFCAPGECTFPYGDPSDGVMVYEDGPCTEIREALWTVIAGPSQAFQFGAADGVTPDIDERQVRTEADANWQRAIDAYGGMGDVPEGVTTALGRAGAIEGDLALAYLRVLEFDALPPADASEAAWDGVYGAMAGLMDAKQENMAPIVVDLDDRCAPIGTSA